MRFADEPAECPLTRQATRGVRGVNGSVNGPTGSGDLHEEVSLSGDEG